MMIEWSTLHNWQVDWQQPSQAAIARRLRFYERMSSYVKGQLVAGVNQVRQGHERLVNNYCFGYRDQLSPDSSVASTPRLRRLLQIAGERLSTEYIGDQVWFEAISTFDQAVSVALIEQDEAMEHLGLTMERLIRLLSDHLFAPGFEKIDFYAYHDPSQDFVVPPTNVGFNRVLHRPGMFRRKMRLSCRRIRNDGFAFLHHRLKDPFRTWLKMQRQLASGNADNPFDVTDRAALTLVAPTVEEALELGDRVLRLLEEHGAEITEELNHNYDVDAPADRHNGESSPHHNFAKAAVFWNDVEIELQFLTFADYFSSQRALSDTNHELYKVKQAARFYLPLLWPTALYDVDWTNPYVLGRLHAWKVAQLDWVVQEFENGKQGLYPT